jgi:hypothetical protein
MKDLGVNFFLNEADAIASTPRADAIIHRLHELNPLCKVRTAAALTDELILSHSVLVITDFRGTAELIRLNELCRGANISFLYAFTGGISASVFVDHGPNHIVCDPNGEKSAQKLITDITKLSATEALIRYDHPAGQLPVALIGGNYDITDVRGINNINGKTYAASHRSSDPAKTLYVDNWNTAELSGEYVSGGLLTEKKLPTPHPMSSLAEKIRSPGSSWEDPPTLVLTDLLNFGAELQQHVSLFATLSFFDQNGRLPAPNSVEDSNSVLDCAKALIAGSVIVLDDFDIDENAVKR